MIDMLVFAYASSEHDCNYRYSLNVIGNLIEHKTFGLPVHFWENSRGLTLSN